ncbi:prephenate dehydrogenase [Paeniglutamicibacter sp. ZC-3]|uniref:prephenate dehydrogenase n=1 Tax=Paeniglutamicibacter TaxID=1742990 RepID=UPI0021F79647|nr:MULTISPECIES: prephenate dehydrogenase [Paeniglutamicibacter]MCV9995476.1 prephenate dehydrogenase [Paeniglutamicibacter sp. ZC-3]MDO2932808.1 prephenate dehydrogenase [Paeniglutamicibacter sulfureus]
MPTTHLAGPILVIGTGLLGTSVGLGLSQRGLNVWLADPSPSAQIVAQDIGAGTIHVPGRPLAPELVVVGAPPDVTAAVVAQALLDFPMSTVVDIASVKGSILEAVRADPRIGEEHLSRYVGTHPMSGRERSGPAAARGELFTSMPWVICAHAGSRGDSVKTAEALAIDLGATVARMNAADHDAAVALISHFPQVASSLIASRLLNAPGHSLALAGNGLRDTTRIAASDPKLWIQILSHNAGALVPILRGMQEDLQRLVATLEDPSAPGALLDLAQLMGEGNAGQARIPGKHGAPPQAFALVTVAVKDKPGQVARLLADVGNAGINMEDLRMEHSAGHQVGLVDISVIPGRREELITVLSALGWKVVQ